MARLDEYLFGYYKCKVEPKDVPKTANLLLRLGISSDLTPDGSFFLRKRDVDSFKRSAKAAFRFELGSPCGLYGALLSLRYSYGILLAIALSVLIFLFSFGRIWDVRIDGNEQLTDRQVEAYLAEQGLEMGKRWRKIDKNSLENGILTENPDVAWISVNRRGTVAYVQLIESENVHTVEEASHIFSNIVAECDGVIEEITVESGVAAVKVGDVVKAGEVLISGIVENEGGTHLCRAKGTVRASCVTELCAEVTENATERVAKKYKMREIRLFIFNFSINIFKNYGNCENTCDIIRENRSFALFGRLRLPIRLEKAYTVEYEERQYSRARDEMSAQAKRDLDGMIYSVFKDSDVLKIRTESSFSDGVYRIRARVVYSTDVGKESAIEIN